MENPFVEWLLETLDARGMSRQDLADKMGMQSAPLTNIVNRRKNLGVKLAKRIALALNIDQSEIFKIAQLQDDDSDGELDPITAMAVSVIKKMPLEDREMTLDYVNMIQRRNERKRQKLIRASEQKS